MVIAWQDLRDGPSHIYAATTTDGGATWSANVRVDDDTGTSSKNSPSIVASPNGHVHLAWVDYRNGNADIYAASSDDGGVSWSGNTRVDDGPGTAMQLDPRLLATTDGKLWAIWQDQRASYHVRVVASSDNGATWGTSVQVDDSAADVLVAQPLLTGYDGTRLRALWLDFRNANYDVRTARSTDGGATWGGSAPVNLDDTGSARQSYVRLAADNQGNTLAIWQDYGGHTGSRLYAAFRPITGTWGSNVRIDAASDSQYGPDLLTDGIGTWYAAWYDYRDGNTNIFSSHSTDNGATWSAAVRVNDVVGSSLRRSPHLAIDGGGTLYAVWNDNRSGNGLYGLYVATSNDHGQTWSTNLPVPPASEHSQWQWGFTADLAAGEPGHLYLVWGQNSTIWFSESNDAGATWSAAYQVNDVSTDSRCCPSIAVAPDGSVHVAWDDSRNGNGSDNIYYSRRDPAGVWGANVRVDDDTFRADNLDLTVDDAGNAYLIWQDVRNGDWDIYYSYRAVGGTWVPNKKVDDAVLSSQTQPRIAVDKQGRLYAVWEDGRDGPTHPYFAWRYSPAPYDFNQNGEVDGGDVQSDAVHWRQQQSDPGWNSRFDLNGDGVINVLDILEESDQIGQ